MRGLTTIRLTLLAEPRGEGGDAADRGGVRMKRKPSNVRARPRHRRGGRCLEIALPMSKTM
jgi:hypothetical protein